MNLNNRSRTAIRQWRTGFTLPELLVATALSLVIMAIIAVAFQKGIDAFRVLRAVASMQDKLKSAENVLKRDLASEHFSGTFKPGFAGPFLRDQRLDLTSWYPPDEGYFRITQGTDSINEGQDSDGLPSFRATNHALQFTVKLSGKRDEDWFRTNYIPNGLGPPWSPIDFWGNSSLFVSRWAEVAYFLAPQTANGITETANGQPLYSLRRQQRVALAVETLATSGGSSLPSISSTTTYPGVSVTQSSVLNTSATLTVAANRMQLSPLSTGDDILLTNVISFEVKMNWSNGTATSVVNAVLPSPTTPAQVSFSAFPDWPFAVPLSSWSVFDTGTRTGAPYSSINWDDPTSYPSASASTTNGIPLRIRVNALQIRIRIWDSSTQTARQLTIVQDV